MLMLRVEYELIANTVMNSKSVLESIRALYSVPFSSSWFLKLYHVSFLLEYLRRMYP